MHIVKAYPPNIEQIKRVFPEAMRPGVMFCYGDTIFSPHAEYVPPQLIAHEEVHSKQQYAVGPDSWWRLYLTLAEFRFEQELEAHIVEYHEFVKTTKRRQMQRDYLRMVAERLSSPLYGKVVSFDEAKAAILRGKLA